LHQNACRKKTKTARKAALAKKQAPKKKTKNKIRQLKRLENANDRVFLKKGTVINMVLYIYGKGESIHDPEIEDLTIKADIWIIEADITWEHFRWGSKAFEYTPRVIIETKDGKITEIWKMMKEAVTMPNRHVKYEMKRRTFYIDNPEWVEDAIRKAL
jgi:hypothetical protein